MKVLVAMDSLKGSLSSRKAGEAVREGILRARPDARIDVRLLADGGEGTAEVLIKSRDGKRINRKVTGPFGTLVNASYGYDPDTHMVFIDMASAVGFHLIREEEKNPMTATTYGVGEMIKDAVNRGGRDFIIGLGGSVTNDGGLGMLEALGYRFTDGSGIPVGRGGQALGKVERIDVSHVIPELAECTFRIACDVENILCGPKGATYIYGPQKGAETEQIKQQLDAEMRHFADVSNAFLGTCCDCEPGSGCGGGIGYAFFGYLHAKGESGAELIMRETKIGEAMKGCDYVVTGEGCLDAQSVMGKAPVRIARLAKEVNAKVIAFAGSVTKESKKCNACGIDAYFPIVRGITTREEAMNPQKAYENLADTAEQVFRLL